jgi:hypothetical protein
VRTLPSDGPTAPRERQGARRIAVVVLLAAFFAESSLGIESESVTYDEGAAIGSAYLAFRQRDLRLIHERPPLLGLFITVPLVVSGEPRLPAVGDPRDDVADYHFGDALLHDMGNDPIRVLRVCRYTVLVLSVGLGLALYAWAFRLGGSAAGLLALVLFSLCPNLLAHSRIAANDMTCAIFVFVALFALERALRDPSPRRTIGAGITLGFALTSKLSAALILPLVPLVCLLAGPSAARAVVPRLGLLLVAALLTVGACMGGTFDYPAYVSAFRDIYKATGGAKYLWYLGGEFSWQPWWYYHLYAAAIKTPLPLMLLFATGTAVFLRRERRWAERALVLGPILLFVGASCFDRANIGLRRILPIYPFVILVASQAVQVGLPRLPKAALLGLLVLWQLASLVRVTPHHLSYFNELVGGPRRGIFHLDDSNIDWGQDLPSLRRWLDAHPGLPVRLAYWGTGRPATYGMTLPLMTESREICDPLPAVYAVSAHYLVYFEKVARVQGPRCSWLTRYQAADRIAYSMYIYDFRRQPGREERS